MQGTQDVTVGQQSDYSRTTVGLQSDACFWKNMYIQFFNERCEVKYFFSVRAKVIVKYLNAVSLYRLDRGPAQISAEQALGVLRVRIIAP